MAAWIISNCLIMVYTLAKLLPIEEILQQLENLWDSSRATHQHDIVDGALIHLGIPQTPL